MPHLHLGLFQRLSLRLLAAGRALWRTLSHPRVSLVMDPARLAGSPASRPIVLIPGRILVMRPPAPRGPR